MNCLTCVDNLSCAIRIGMAGRGGWVNAGVAAAIHSLIATMVQKRRDRPAPVTDNLRIIDLFGRMKPSHFKGGYDPEGAQAWLLKLERIFEAMQCMRKTRCSSQHIPYLGMP